MCLRVSNPKTYRRKDPHSTAFYNTLLSRFGKFVSKLWGEIGEVGEIVQSGSGLVGGLGGDFFPEREGGDPPRGGTPYTPLVQIHHCIENIDCPTMNP